MFVQCNYFDNKKFHCGLIDKAPLNIFLSRMQSSAFKPRPMKSKTIKLHSIPADSTGQLIDAIAPAIGLIKNCPIFKIVSPKANALLNYVGRTT